MNAQVNGWINERKIRKINGWLDKQIRVMWIYTTTKRSMWLSVSVTAAEGEGRVETKPQECSQKNQNG